MRTQCPSCKTALSAPDASGPQRLRCPFCATAFTAGGDDFTLPETAPARPPADREMLQTGKDRPPAAVRTTTPPSRERRTPVIARKPSAVPLGLLLGIGAGLFSCFLLFVALVLWFVLSPYTPNPSASPPKPPEEVAGGGLNPVLDPARQVAGGAQAVPEAPPAADGKEEFIDLPERGQDLPGIAGLNPEPQPGAGRAPGMAGAGPRVALIGVRTVRMGGQPGMTFQVHYRFEQGTPGERRFAWVIVTGRGQSFKMSLDPGALRQQGTLSGRFPLNNGQSDAPYRTYLILDPLGAPGGVEEKVSNELTVR